jgi:iduronate 2-sulfatase
MRQSRLHPRGTIMGYSLRTARWRFTEWIDSKTGEIRERELYDHAFSSLAARSVASDPEHADQVEALARQLNSAGRAERAARK